MLKSIATRARSAATIGLVAVLVSVLSGVPNAYAASSWNPTVLVNTESFQTIDDGDGTTDIELRFGDSLSRRLFFDKSESRFRITDDFVVEQNLTASGSLSVSGNVVLGDQASDTVTVDAGTFDFTNQANIGLKADQVDALTFGNDLLSFDTSNNRVGIGTAAPDSAFEVSGTISGTALAVSGDNFTVSADGSVSAADGAYTISSAGNVNTTGNIEASGTITGAKLDITSRNVSIGGVDYIFPAGDGSSSGMVLGTDAQGNLTWTNSLDTSTLDSRYVEIGGDTMTGALVIEAAGGLTVSGATVLNEDGNDYDTRIEGDTDEYLFFADASTDRIGIGKQDATTKLDVDGTISGTTLSIDDGDFTIGADGAIVYQNSSTVTLNNAVDALNFDSNTLSIDAQNNRIGIGTAAPDAELEVQGAISGETLAINGDNFTVDASGNTEAQGQLSGATLTAGGGDFTVDASGNVVAAGTASVAGGNFTVNADGDTAAADIYLTGTASIAGGNFTVDANGAVSASNGNFTIASNGNTNTSGNFEAAGTITGAVLDITSNRISIAGVDYLFPASDGSSSGMVLGTDSNGQLSWTNSLDTGTLDDRYVNTSGDTMTGDLVLSNGAALSVSGNILGNGNITAEGVLSGATLSAGGGDFTVGATGNVATTGNIEADGSISGATIHSSGNLTSSGNLIVEGSISGSSLTVDGNVTIHGVTYSFPTTQGGSGQVLVNDGSGNLSWSSSLSSSGDIISLHAEFPNAVYFASGSNTVGQLTYDYDTSTRDNFYRWSSTKTALNDYWVSTRVRVPDNFDAWSASAPIEYKLRTTSDSTSDQSVKILVLDTAGAIVTDSTLASSTANTWRTGSLSITGGTFTPGSYMTVLVKLAAKDTTNFADISYIDLNFETTTP